MIDRFGDENSELAGEAKFFIGNYSVYPKSVNVERSGYKARHISVNEK